MYLLTLDYILTVYGVGIDFVKGISTVNLRRTLPLENDLFENK